MRYTNNSSATNSSLLHQKTQTGVLWGLFPSWNSIKQFSVGGGWRARHLVATCVISNICLTVIFLLSLRQDKTHFCCKMCCFSGDHVVSWTQHGGRIYWTWCDYHHNLLEWNHEVVCEVKLKPLGEDITLPTKVHIVKAMIFPVVMYGCESWTKKAECWRTDSFELGAEEDSWESLELQGDQTSIFTGRTDAETEAPILWPPDVKSWLIGKDPDAGKDWRQEKGTIEDEMVGRHHWLDRQEFEQAVGDGEGQGSLVKDREAWRATVHGVAKSQTWLSDWTTTGRRRKYCETCLSVLGQGWCAWCLFIRSGC